MYKVFFNDRIVFINTKDKSGLFKEAKTIEVFDNTDMPELLEAFINDPEQLNIELVGSSVDDLKRKFFELFKIVEAAGGLVFNSQNELLCIYRWGKWDLPKGKIEKGESPDVAAVREVEEETNITGVTIREKRTVTYHIYKSPYHSVETWILKPTHWYVMDYTGNEKLVPQIKEDITKAEWFGRKDALEAQKNTYASLFELFEY